MPGTGAVPGTLGSGGRDARPAGFGDSPRACIGALPAGQLADAARPPEASHGGRPPGGGVADAPGGRGSGRCARGTSSEDECAELIDRVLGRRGSDSNGFLGATLVGDTSEEEEEVCASMLSCTASIRSFMSISPSRAQARHDRRGCASLGSIATVGLLHAGRDRADGELVLSKALRTH